MEILLCERYMPAHLFSFFGLVVFKLFLRVFDEVFNNR